MSADTAGLPYPVVTPTVGGTAKARQEFGDGTNDVRYLMVTASSDVVEAGGRFATPDGDVDMLQAGGTIVITSDTAITSVHIVAIGDTTSGTLAAGELVTDAETEANYRTAMVTFDFESADDIRRVVISASDLYSTSASGPNASTGNYVSTLMRGYSYA